MNATAVIGARSEVELRRVRRILRAVEQSDAQPPTWAARAVLKLLLRRELAGCTGPFSAEAMGGELCADPRRVRHALAELNVGTGYGLVFVPEGPKGRRASTWATDLGRIEAWAVKGCPLEDLGYENGTATAGLSGTFGTTTEPLLGENGPTTSRARVTAAAVGVTGVEDEDAELKVLAEEARRLLAQANVPMARVLMPEVVDELRKGSTLADFRLVARELAAGPASMRAWRTALPILARLRRERMGAAGLIEFPAVGAL